MLTYINICEDYFRLVHICSNLSLILFILNKIIRQGEVSNPLCKQDYLLSKFVFNQRLSPKKFFVHQRLSPIKICLLTNIIFFQSLSSIKDYLQIKFVFHQRLSPIKICLLTNIISHKHSSSIKDYLPSKFVFHLHQRLSSIKFCLPLKDIINYSTKVVRLETIT